MSIYVIVEGPVPRKLLERMIDLHPGLRDRRVKVIETSGRSSAQALGMSILLIDRVPVAVVMDDDRGDLKKEGVDDCTSRELMAWILGKGGPRSEWKIALLKPCTEALLFQYEELRRAVLPAEPTAEQLQRARKKPRKVLAELFKQAGAGPYPEALLERLDKVDPSVLWAHKQLQRLESFLLEKVAERDRELGGVQWGLNS